MMRNLITRAVNNNRTKANSAENHSARSKKRHSPKKNALCGTKRFAEKIGKKRAGDRYDPHKVHELKDGNLLVHARSPQGELVRLIGDPKQGKFYQIARSNQKGWPFLGTSSGQNTLSVLLGMTMPRQRITTSLRPVEALQFGVQHSLDAGDSAQNAPADLLANAEIYVPDSQAGDGKIQTTLEQYADMAKALVGMAPEDSNALQDPSSQEIEYRLAASNRIYADAFAMGMGLERDFLTSPRTFQQAATFYGMNLSPAFGSGQYALAAAETGAKLILMAKARQNLPAWVPSRELDFLLQRRFEGHLDAFIDYATVLLAYAHGGVENLARLQNRLAESQAPIRTLIHAFMHIYHGSIKGRDMGRLGALDESRVAFLEASKLMILAKTQGRPQRSFNKFKRNHSLTAQIFERTILSPMQAKGLTNETLEKRAKGWGEKPWDEMDKAVHIVGKTILTAQENGVG